MVDMTGSPRSREDYEEALEAVKTVMRKPPMDLPLLVVQLGTIKDGLELLIEVEKLREARGISS